MISAESATSLSLIHISSCNNTSKLELMMPTLTKRLTATATIRSKIETDITTISSFALIPAQSINGTQLKIHRTTPIPTDIVNFPEKSFFFSLTMPSTPYSVSISSLPRNSYLEDSLPLKINRNTATVSYTHLDVYKRQ